jgi:hypothetical protein
MSELKQSTLVPKVHPLARSVEADDPLELVATPVAGDPDYMLQCMIEEFAWMGMNAGELLGLFRNPAYPLLNQLMHHFGEDAICERVQGLLANLRGLRFSAIVDEEPEPDEYDEPELIQVSVGRVADGCSGTAARQATRS